MNNPSIKEIRNKYQYSSSDSWYARIVCRRFSVYFTWLLLRTPITPNQITSLMILIGIVGGIFLGMKGSLNGLIGVLFLQLFLIFDCVDGEIARYKRKFSSKGKLLDLIANDVVFISLFSGLIFKIFNGNYKIFNFSLSYNPLVTILGISATIFFLLFKLSSYYAKEVDQKLRERDSFLKLSIFNTKIKLIILQIVNNLASPPTIIVIVTLGAIFNIFSYILFFYAVFFPLYYFASLALKLKNKEVKQ